MRQSLADTLALFAAYMAAFLLRFDFQTPRWGWEPVLTGFLAAAVLGWFGLRLFRCHRLSPRTITLKNLPRFALAALFTVLLQLILRYLITADEAIVLRPPASVAIMGGILELAFLLMLRYVPRLQLRPIEIADLLGRTESEVGTVRVRTEFGNRRVLITGAGGSIGSELARQVLAAGPAKLILLDISEAALYVIHSELSASPHAKVLMPVVGDCSDTERIRGLLQQEQPDIILHAAAYKHVPMMEFNPSEALTNNALGTRRLAEVACEEHIGTFVLISTDKAIRPISAMGISKRLAELFTRDLATEGSTRFCAVRFGNVLGSSGSVVPLFRKQIAAGGPVTVTDPRMERYFMTIAEASGLVLQAATLAKGGEIFVLDMGRPVTILSLAESMIRLAGLRPHRDIKIVYSGIRPGEKLSEELGVSAANAERTDHERIFVGHIPQWPRDAVKKLIKRCEELAGKGIALTVGDLRTLLNDEERFQA